MGGCATKPNVLKEEGEAPKPAEDLAGQEKKEEVAEGRKSLGNFFAEKEAEENTATVNEEKKPEEEKEDAKPEQLDEEKKATEASEAKADTAADEEKQQ